MPREDFRGNNTLHRGGSGQTNSAPFNAGKGQETKRDE
jgi:hypothetical protein